MIFKGTLDVKADWPTTKRVKVHHFDKEVKTQKKQKGKAKNKKYSINEKYPWRGNHSLAVNHCNGV